jgi:hypothetical protein
MFLYFLISLRLHFRNKLALLYSYLFPTLFLIAFWVLYRYDQVPLVRHLGELLTVTALGGACFGLPTTMVAALPPGARADRRIRRNDGCRAIRSPPHRRSAASDPGRGVGHAVAGASI